MGEGRGRIQKKMRRVVRRGMLCILGVIPFFFNFFFFLMFGISLQDAYQGCLFYFFLHLMSLLRGWTSLLLLR